uniref:Phospholipid scramblase n=1 Tax=Romanomermis culicivorax TaxID=13658 RepID=A0A915I1L6_ROMCU
MAQQGAPMCDTNTMIQAQQQMSYLPPNYRGLPMVGFDCLNPPLFPGQLLASAAVPPPRQFQMAQFPMMQQVPYYHQFLVPPPTLIRPMHSVQGEEMMDIPEPSMVVPPPQRPPSATNPNYISLLKQDTEIGQPGRDHSGQQHKLQLDDFLVFITPATYLLFVSSWSMDACIRLYMEGIRPYELSTNYGMRNLRSTSLSFRICGQRILNATQDAYNLFELRSNTLKCTIGNGLCSQYSEWCKTLVAGIVAGRTALGETTIAADGKMLASTSSSLTEIELHLDVSAGWSVQ